MSVHILDPDAYDKLITMEGEAWKKEGERITHDDFYSFHAFRGKYEAVLKNTEQQALFPDMFLSVEGSTAIYGACGYNLYLVKNTGEIFFSRMHARNDEAIEKAKSLGFSIR